MKNKNDDLTLSQFVIKKREELNLSQVELAKNCELDLEQIVSIEQGIDLFLPTTIRQKLAKGLKVENKEIKRLEKKEDFKFAKQNIMDEIREQIILNSSNPDFKINCPICNEPLITRIAKLYDLEDNLILRAKARCSKCPFQLTD